MDDIMEMLSSGSGRSIFKGHKKQKLQPMKFQLELTLDEIYSGTTTIMRITRKRICPKCKGEGCSGGRKAEKCYECKGRGIVKRMIQQGPGMYLQTNSACSTCHGKGENIDEKFICKNCLGEKVKEEKKELNVEIPPGISPGESIYFYGEGNELPELDPGDAIFIIKEKEHEKFKRRGDDIILNQKIGLREALCGGIVTIDFLCEKKINILIEQGQMITHKMIKTVEGLGMPKYKKQKTFGKLFIIFDIEFPYFENIPLVDKFLDVS